MIVNKYEILNKIGEGMFGSVFRGIYCKRNETVAIKMESSRTSAKLLKHETRILKYLCDKGCDVIPVVHWYGVDENFTYLVMTYYDCSLNDYFMKGGVSGKQLASIMNGCVSILEAIHKWWVVHRDIKPNNFMLRGKELFIIDFGLAMYYLNGDGEHISGSNESIVGSPKYASYYIHDGCVSSRRDDLISLGYMYIALCGESSLPWDNLENEEGGGIENTDITCIFHSKNVVRKRLKSWEVVSENCFGTVRNYLKYCYSLKLDETPNYEYLCRMF